MIVTFYSKISILNNSRNYICTSDNIIKDTICRISRQKKKFLQIPLRDLSYTNYFDGINLPGDLIIKVTPTTDYDNNLYPYYAFTLTFDYNPTYITYDFCSWLEHIKSRLNDYIQPYNRWGNVMSNIPLFNMDIPDVYAVCEGIGYISISGGLTYNNEFQEKIMLSEWDISILRNNYYNDDDEIFRDVTGKIDLAGGMIKDNKKDELPYEFKPFNLMDKYHVSESSFGTFLKYLASNTNRLFGSSYIRPTIQENIISYLMYFENGEWKHDG